MECLLLCCKPGNSNPMSWINKCHCELVNQIQHRKSRFLTSNNLYELRCFMKMSNIKHRYTEEGLTLYWECKDLFKYLKETITLNKLMKASKPIFKDDEIDNCSSISKKADQLYRNNKNFRNNIVICFLKAIVA